MHNFGSTTLGHRGFTLTHKAHMACHHRGQEPLNIERAITTTAQYNTNPVHRIQSHGAAARRVGTWGLEGGSAADMQQLQQKNTTMGRAPMART